MKKLFKNQFFLNIFLVVSLALAVGGAFYFGYQKGVQEGAKETKNVVISGINNMSAGQPAGVDFSIFWQTWKELKDKYVYNNKLNNQDLVYGAVAGLVGAAKDPYTVFFPPSDAKKFSEDISGAFSGIGAEIGMRNDQLVVIAPLKGTPAERAGLKPLDKILAINGTSTEGIIVDDAVKLIRGPRGSKITLTILRNNWDKPKDISIVRDTIEIPTLDWEIKDGKIAYFHLYNFYENAPLLMYQKVLKTILVNPKGIILDLRNNPGGYLEGAVNIVSWFLSPGQLVVSEEFASGKKDKYKSDGSGVLKNVPIVILLNEGSASASEILAGAIREHSGDNRAEVRIVGKKSFGKGTVQQLEDLQGGATLKITIAHWLTPSGKLIDKNGIMPDYEIEITDKDLENNKDPQLEEALKIIKQLIAGRF